MVMIIDVERWGFFRLDTRFLDEYRERPVNWGFGDLSWVTYKRTYSRDGEDWWQTCQRVIEGMFTIQRVHCLRSPLSIQVDPAGARPVDDGQRLYLRARRCGAQ